MFARQTITGVAAQQSYALTIEFLSSDFLTVTVTGSPVSFSVSDDHNTLTIVGTPITGGETILVTRSTPAGDNERLVDFQDLSQCRQADLDRSALQLLHIAQETLDVIAAAERLELSGVSGQWDGESRRIQNLAAGVDDTDAATKGQLDALSIAAGNLPVVSVADNDKGLWVVAGAWAIRTPAQGRTHLGLGTAATLNAGVAALNAVQLDGSARYPANSGQNIDLSTHALLNLRYRTTLGSVRQSTLATPANNGTGTWSQTAGSRLTPGTLTSLDNSSDVVVDNGANKVTLSIGTWEIHWIVRAYNVNAAAGNDQNLRIKLTNDDDTAGQTVYDADYDLNDIESAGAGTTAVTTLSNTLLLKLAAGGTVVLRADNRDGVDIRILNTLMVFRKVSTST